LAKEGLRGGVLPLEARVPSREILFEKGGLLLDGRGEEL